PSRTQFTIGIGSGTCGRLDADGNPNFFSLACGGLYVGGAFVGVPLPLKVPDQGSSISNVCCSGTALTVFGTTPAQAGGSRCIQGANSTRGASCTTNSDCAWTCATDADCSPTTSPPSCVGGSCANAKCAFEKCTNAGCLFGPPLPFPNSSH